VGKHFWGKKAFLGGVLQCKDRERKERTDPWGFNKPKSLRAEFTEKKERTRAVLANKNRWEATYLS